MKKIMLASAVIVLSTAFVFTYKERSGHDETRIATEVVEPSRPVTLEDRINAFQLRMHDRLIALDGEVDALREEAELAAWLQQDLDSTDTEGEITIPETPLLRQLENLDRRVWDERWNLLHLEDADEANWPDRQWAEEKRVTAFEVELERLREILEASAAAAIDETGTDEPSLEG